MKGLLLGAVIAAGCGRFDFDRVDGHVGGGDDGPHADVVLANHDEDGDGIDDAIDKCPMIADDQADGDGDGVGAACDPDDGVAAQHLVLFDPMLTATGVEQITGTWTAMNDEVVLSGTAFAELDRNFAITNADIWIGYDITAIAGGTQQVITHPSEQTTPLRYYGQLYHTSGVNEATVLSYDGATYTSLDSMPLSMQGVHTGMLVTITRVRTNPGFLEHVARWNGDNYDVMATTPSYTGSARFRIQVDGIAVGVRFIAVVTTN